MQKHLDYRGKSLSTVFHGSMDSEKSYLLMRYPELRVPSLQGRLPHPSLTCQTLDKSLLLAANMPLHVVFASQGSYEDELNTEREVLSSGPGKYRRAQKYCYRLRNEGLSIIRKMVEKTDGRGRCQSTLRHSINVKD